MLIEEIKLSELQSIYLLDKDNLPNCAAIYVDVEPYYFNPRRRVLFV